MKPAMLTAFDGCRCRACIDIRHFMGGTAGWPFDENEAFLFIVCALCGNKRCPHATNHLCQCTESNDTDQGCVTLDA